MITEYDPSYAARARDLCMLGCTEMEIANLLGISVGMLRAWRDRYPEFSYAWDDGAYHASTKVLAALYKKALGYDYIKWKETKDGMMREQVHVEANIPACIFWLTNKHPEQWKSKVEHETTGGTLIPVDTMTEIEAARRVAFTLSKAINDIKGIDNGDSTVPVKTK